MQNSDTILFEIEKFLQYAKTERSISDAQWASGSEHEGTTRECIESHRRNTVYAIKRFVLNDSDYRVIKYSPTIDEPLEVGITLLNGDDIYVNLVDYFACIILAPNIWIELEKKLIANELT